MSCGAGTCLSGLDDDTLIYIFSFLDIDDLLRMRRVSTRFDAISRLRVVWTRALTVHVHHEGVPFPPVAVDTLPTPTLEHLVHRARRISRFWLHSAGDTDVLLHAEFAASSGTGISDVRLLPAHPRWVLAVARGIWPVVTCWNVGLDEGGGSDTQGVGRPTKAAEWFRKGALFTGIVVNSDPGAEACLAVSLSFSGEDRVEVLAIREDGESGVQFITLATIKTGFRAMAFKGDILALSDDVNETQLVNWRTNALACIWGSDAPSEHNFRHNRCLCVLLSSPCTFVVRARTFEAFHTPALAPPTDTTHPQHHPIATHHFGWLDGVAVAAQAKLPGDALGAASPRVSVLLRAESDDPWASHMHTVDLYTLDPHPACPSAVPACDGAHHQSSLPTPGGGGGGSGSPSADSPSADSPSADSPSPYPFPPAHAASFPGARGHLRCTDMHLGRHGTALWIAPRAARSTSVGLAGLDALVLAGVPGVRRERERVVGALLPGVLRDGRGEDGEEGREEGGGGPRTLWSSAGAGGTWTSLDYDEARGVVVLGDSTGVVTVLRLA